MSELYQLVRTLRAGDCPSRNRNFEALSHPVARRARKVARRLDSLARELRSGARVEVRRLGDGVAITLEWPEVRLHRTAYLTDEEHALLGDDPSLAALLAPT